VTQPRFSRPGDEISLHRLWRIVFSDEASFIETFFQEIYFPGSAAVAEANGEIVSAAYVISFGSARYIYAVATLPEYRGRGLGKAVTLLAADGKPAYLCPASPGLCRWYQREMGAEVVAFRPAFDPPAGLRRIAPEEYAARREALLADVPHASYPRGVLDLFALTGEFYADSRGGICALEDGEIREALPCRFTDEPHILGLNGAKPLYWGLTLE